MVRAGYFGVDLEWISIEVWVAGESATCCGVNLAVAGFGVVVFSQAAQGGVVGRAVAKWYKRVTSGWT